MDMNHFHDVHYPAAYQSVDQLDPLSQEVYQLVRLEPSYTGSLRTRAITGLACTQSQFDTSLKKLQVSLNIVRSNDPKHKHDFWLSMREVHLDIVQQYE